MAPPQKPPYIIDPQSSTTGRPASVIFLHGFGDEAKGMPLGIAQQFLMHKKLTYVRWVLPNAPLHPQAFTQAWYVPKGGPSYANNKPRTAADDDEPGILASVAYIDSLVAAELARGVPPERIVVGGFSQGCAVSLLWGLVGQHRDNVGGVAMFSGNFPLKEKIAELRRRNTAEGAQEGKARKGSKKWLVGHGSRDAMIPARLFEQATVELKKYVDEADLEAKLYEGVGHSTSPAMLRDLLVWLEDIIPA